MKKITLKELTLRNFKGVKDLTINPNQVTNIYGDNKTGKTTIAISQLWLFLGKDQFDRKDYEIKTLDKNNKPIHKIEHEVCAVYDVDGKEVKIQRIYKEKWGTTRGSSESVFKGNETLFLWNEVPLQQKDFIAKVVELIGDEIMFKMLTNPLYFNDDNLIHWKDRRKVLVGIVGEDSDSIIIGKNEDFKELFDRISGKSFDEYKLEISNKKKNIKELLENIPTRIDELVRNTPEAVDFEKIKKEIAEIDLKIKSIEESIVNKNKPTEKYYKDKREHLKLVDFTNTTIRDLKLKAEKQIASSSGNNEVEVEKLKGRITSLESLIKGWQNTIDRNTEESDNIDLGSIRKELDDLNETKFEFDDSKSVCPTCNRKLEEEDIAEQENDLRLNFNTNKQQKGAEINRRGKQASERLTHLTKENELFLGKISDSEKSILKLQERIKGFSEPKEVVTIEEVLEKDADYKKTKADLDNLNAKVFTPPVIDISGLQEEKTELSKKRDELKEDLSKESQIKSNNERKIELETEEKGLAQKLSDLEKDQYTMECFEKTKMDSLEEKINKLFSTIKFKLFKDRINGGYEPWCEALINGVPYMGANTASQVNTGIEIINVLNKHFGVSLPICIDGRESIINLVDTKNQILNFVVLEDKSGNEDKSIRDNYLENVRLIEEKGDIVLTNKK